MIRIVDTFKDYVAVFEESPETVEDRIAAWETYIKAYPELENKMKGDYQSMGMDWYQAALEVYSKQVDHYPKMLEAYDLLKVVTPQILEKAQDIYGLAFDIDIVYYAALENSAGWVDTYGGKRAVLIGIDKIAALGWHTKVALETLIAHELIHAIHFHVRGIDLVDPNFEDTLYDNGIWYLYEEGMAKYFETSLSGHANGSRGEAWRKACMDKERDLKAAYKAALSHEGTGAFYGDWYQVHGLSDTGYSLGARMIENLSKTMDFESLACLSKKAIEDHVMHYLSQEEEI